jgi:3-hydroxyacyl-CoA dehydrogenase
VLTLDLPPANALSASLRGALMVALSGGEAPDVRAVVLIGAGRNFSAATSVDAAGGPDHGRPALAELCAMVEGFAKPVVAVLTGATVGPGAELALAAHARVAAADARIVFPEVGLGLPPSGGATQRLPRLVGVADALDLLLAARQVSAAEALAMGLIDHLVEGDALAAGVAYAAAMSGPRPTFARTGGLADIPGARAAIAAAREGAARGVLPAPARIVDCVEAALYLPFENGLAMEAVAHEDLAGTEESQGLIAAAQAERRAAALPPAVLQAEAKAVAHLGLVGSAPQMAPLALIALGRGLRVTWVEPDKARLDPSVQWIADRLDAEVRGGRITPAQRDADRARLGPSADPAALAGAGLVIHAPGGADPAALMRRMPDVPQLVLGGAEGALGLGLAPSARIAELALPQTGRPELVATAVQLLRRLGIPPLLVGRMPVVGRRVSNAGRAALARLLALGVPRRVLEGALDGFGQAMPDLPEPETPSPMRAMSETEVIRRMLAAMANEGFRLLDGRVARHPSDVDHALVQGWGFPRWRGGPMHHAATRGLMVMRADMHVWLKDDPMWEPHPLIDRMIADGRRLDELDRA